MIEPIRKFIKEYQFGYFLRGGAWLSVGFLLSYILAFFRSIVFARFLDQQVYGQFTFANSVLSALAFLSLPGVNIALIETVARGNYGSLKTAAQARFRWSLLVSLGIVLTSAYYLWRGQSDLAVALLLLALLTPFLFAVIVVMSYFNGQKRFDLISKINLFITASTTLLLVLIVLGHGGLLVLVLANTGIQVLVYGFFYLRATAQVANAPSDPHMLPYGRSLSIAGAITALTDNLDSVILGFTAGFVNLAVYNVATIIPENLAPLTKMLLPLALPHIASQPESRIYTPRTRFFLLLLLLAGLLLVAVAIAAIPFVLTILAGERYTNAVFLAQLLMFSLSTSLPEYYLTAVLQARKQTALIFRSNLVTGILQITTLVLLGPWLGIPGILISRIATRLFTAAYLWRVVSRL